MLDKHVAVILFKKMLWAILFLYTTYIHFDQADGRNERSFLNSVLW